jgi:lipoyl(octanoyl) transferase
MTEITFIDLGLRDYKETWDYQAEIHQKVLASKAAGKPINYLIFVEHPHVYTLGRSGKENNLLIRGPLLKKIEASFYKTDRGGDITYHGPGQIVGYPIFDLESFQMGIKKYIYSIEQVIINTLAGYGMAAMRMNGATGVWLDAADPQKARKICAIGVKVSRAVTMHGFALNVNTDLNYFRYINPCGFIDKGVTSVEKELGTPQDMDEVKSIILKNFEHIFEIRILLNQ